MSEKDDFLWTDDELEEHLAKFEAGEDVGDLTISDQNQCEALLRKIDAYRDECGEIEEHFQSQLQSLKDWRMKRARSRIKSINYLKDILFSFLRLSDKSTLSLVAGDMRKTKGRASIKVFDFEKLREFAEKHEIEGLVRQPPTPDPEPDKKGIAAYKKNTAKLPPGTEEEIGPDTFSVKTSTAPHEFEAKLPDFPDESV